jgi:copper(I)-binding protein
MQIKSLLRVAMLMCSLLLLSACGAPSGPSNVIVKDAWSRPAAQGQVGGVYMTIENSGGTDRLLSLTSEVSDAIEIHETKSMEGMMHMSPLAGGLEVPAGGKVDLKPGGLHIMLMNLNRELKVGESFKLTLKLQSSKEITVEVQVRANA